MEILNPLSSLPQEIMDSVEASLEANNSKYVFRKSVQKIVEQQRIAFQYFHNALLRFQSVTDDLESLLENTLIDQLDNCSPIDSINKLEEEEKKPIDSIECSQHSPTRKRARHKNKKQYKMDAENADTLDKLLHVKNFCNNSDSEGKYVAPLEIISKDQRLTEFVGELYQKRRQEPSSDPFVYEFVFHGENMCIDSSLYDCKGKYIRYDGVNPNCRVELEVLEDTPRLFFYSIRDINTDEILTCDFQKGLCKRINLDACLSLSESPKTIPFEACVKEDPRISNDEEEYFSEVSLPILCTTEFDPPQEELSLQSTSNDICGEESLCQSDMEMLSYWESLTNSLAVRNGTDKIVIKQCNRNETNGKRIYDRKQACIFCGKSVFKIARHWDTFHSNNDLIKKLKSLPQGEEKKNIQSILRKKGNYNHNIKVMEQGHGEIIVTKRSLEKFGPKDYFPCAHCFGFLNRKEWKRHCLSCSHRNSNHLQELLKLAEAVNS